MDIPGLILRVAFQHSRAHGRARQARDAEASSDKLNAHDRRGLSPERAGLFMAICQDHRISGPQGVLILMRLRPAIGADVGE
jgi:hypothetical protein